MKTLFLMLLPLLIIPAHAIELHDAIILEHTSSISGADDNGYAIDGYVEEE